MALSKPVSRWTKRRRINTELSHLLNEMQGHDSEDECKNFEESTFGNIYGSQIASSHRSPMVYDTASSYNVPRPNGSKSALDPVVEERQCNSSTYCSPVEIPLRTTRESHVTLLCELGFIFYVDETSCVMKRNARVEMECFKHTW